METLVIGKIVTLATVPDATEELRKALLAALMEHGPDMPLRLTVLVGPADGRENE